MGVLQIKSQCYKKIVLIFVHLCRLVQEYSQTSTLPSDYNSNSQRPETPRKWTARSSPNQTVGLMEQMM